MDVDIEEDFQDLFYKTLQNKLCHGSEGNGERGRLSCLVSESELRWCEHAEREDREADTAWLTLPAPQCITQGMRRSLVHLRDEGNVAHCTLCLKAFVCCVF